MLPNWGFQQFLVHVEMTMSGKSADSSDHSSVDDKNSRLDTSLSTTRPFAILAPSDDPPTEHVPSTVQRLRDRLLRARPHTNGVLRRQLHGPRQLPPRERPRRIAQKRRVVHARRKRRERQRQRRQFDPGRHVLVVRVRRCRRRRLLRLGFGPGVWGGVWGSIWGGVCGGLAEVAQSCHVGPAAPRYERRGCAGGRERCCGECGAGCGWEAGLDYEYQGRERGR